MKSLYIGSADTPALLAGSNTKIHQNLWRRFLSDEIPNYNAFASPIDALRTGAILEERYLISLPDGWYPQIRINSNELDVLRASLDFSKVMGNKVIEFQELKTSSFDDFLVIQDLKNISDNDLIRYIKSKYANNYKQVQQQLFVTELEYATLTYLCVYTYDDDINKQRVIQDNEIVQVQIPRNEEIIDSIKERAQIFQEVKNHFNN